MIVVEVKNIFFYLIFSLFLFSGGGRNFSRRGGSAGQDRPPYEGGNRGGGQQRSQRFHKFEEQPTNETSGFEQGGDAWANETGNDNQTFTGGYRARGRGGPRRGNYEGGRGSGRGRGRGGRGNFNNRNFEEGSQQPQQQQQQQQSQENSGWEQSSEYVDIKYYRKNFKC